MRQTRWPTWVLRIAIVVITMQAQAAEPPPLAPLPVETRWVASVDVTALRTLLHDLKLWDAVAGDAAQDNALARLLTDTDRITLSGRDARREHMLLVVRLAPDAPPWTPLVTGLPDYESRQIGDHTFRQWRAGRELLHATEHDRSVYVSLDVARTQAALAAARHADQQLQPQTRFAGWPKSLTGVILVVAASDIQTYGAGTSSPGIGDLKSLILTVTRVDDTAVLASQLEALDAEKSEQLLNVMQGSVSMGVLSEKLPQPVRDSLKALRCTRDNTVIRIDAVWTLEQIGHSWRALRSTAKPTPAAP